MNDNGDGTYTADYTVSSSGLVTVSVELLTQGGLYTEYFNNMDLSGVPVLTQIEPGIEKIWENGLISPT
jgi:hypothetical protein